MVPPLTAPGCKPNLCSFDDGSFDVFLDGAVLFCRLSGEPAEVPGGGPSSSERVILGGPSICFFFPPDRDSSTLGKFGDDEEGPGGRSIGGAD